MNEMRKVMALSETTTQHSEDGGNMFPRNTGSHLAGYGLDSWSSILGRNKRFFSTLLRSDLLWGPTSLLSSGYKGLFFWDVKMPESEANHPLPPIAEAKNGGAIPPLPHTCSW
jgi:hypothetical protein